ncbi:MAG: hypothetical protein Q8R04_03520 [Nanoarchaeota archaeon]|nr:hypothetical protein [Nanoarchaeota archaeon]
MTDVTTIQLDKKVIEKLKKAKEHPRQTYNELLDKIVSVFISVKKKNSYDEFLHKIQQPKMKELWDNKEDEAWGSV